MKRPIPLVIALALLASGHQLGAQGIYIGLRGTGAIPSGAFNETSSSSSTALLDAAKSGFGYGAEAGVQLGFIGVYASFDHINFDCQSATCSSDGKYKLQGVTAGVRLSAPGVGIARPFVKGGVTFNELYGGYGEGQSNELTTDRTPGYEVGGGVDVGLLGLLNITPQVRYVGQNFKYKVPGVNTTGASNTQGVNYFTFDLGVSIHTPFI